MPETTYKIGNLEALAAAMVEHARIEGNLAQHELGIALVWAARNMGMDETEIVDALCGAAV